MMMMMMKSSKLRQISTRLAPLISTSYHRRPSSLYRTMPEQELVHLHSKTTISPSLTLEKIRCHLTPFDLRLLSIGYIQLGFLFSKHDQELSIIIERIKESLSHALVHFFPLAGCLATERHVDGMGTVFIDCNHVGAEFMHASADKSVADMVSDLKSPTFLHSLFPYDGAINHDGHTLPLLAVQVTELYDGIFMACSTNHVACDGTSFFHFLSSWSEICRERGGVGSISQLPIINRCFLTQSPIHLNLLDHDFTSISPPPILKQKIFHFTQQSITQLKTRARTQTKTQPISSFQALSAHVWQTLTKARDLPRDQQTILCIPVNTRPRLRPPLPPNQFGSYLQIIGARTTVGELLSHDLGHAALMAFKSVEAHTDGAVRRFYEEWVKKPVIPKVEDFGSCNVFLTGSNRFDVCGKDFGWGRPVAAVNGPSHRADGEALAYAGKEEGSVYLDICLSPRAMSALESDEQFMETLA